MFMDKLVKGIGWITILYVGLYLLDTVAMDTGMDIKLESIVNKFIRTKPDSKPKETDKIEYGFH